MRDEYTVLRDISRKLHARYKYIRDHEDSTLGDKLIADAFLGISLEISDLLKTYRLEDIKNDTEWSFKSN